MDDGEGEVLVGQEIEARMEQSLCGALDRISMLEQEVADLNPGGSVARELWSRGISSPLLPKKDT